MPRSLSHWLRSLLGPGDASALPPTRGFEERLRSLEREAEDGAGAFAGAALNRAGDLCVREGADTRAMRYFGRAIDAFLEDHRPEAARAVAQKVIRLHPEAVHTLCTLAWLDLGTGHQGDAREHLRSYVAGAKRFDGVDAALGHVVEMAETVADPDFRAAAADEIERLGFPDEASRVRGWCEDGARTPDPVAADELPRRCFVAAIRCNGFLRDHEAA